MVKKLMMLVVVLVTFTSSAASAVEGKDWDWDPYAPSMIEMTYAHGADIATTALALSLVDSASEMNPLGYWAIGAKVAVSYGLVPLLPEEAQIPVSHFISDVTYGAAVNNLLIACGAGSSVPIVGGVVVGAWLLMCDFEVLPDFLCISGGYDSE